MYLDVVLFFYLRLGGARRPLTTVRLRRPGEAGARDTEVTPVTARELGSAPGQRLVSSCNHRDETRENEFKWQRPLLTMEDLCYQETVLQSGVNVATYYFLASFILSSRTIQRPRQEL